MHFVLISRGQVKEWSIYSCLNAQISLLKSDWTAVSAVDSDLSSEVPYICGYMTFPRAAQQVGCTDICFVDGFEGEFNLCFNNYLLIILLPVPDWFKTSAFKEEKSSRFNTAVCNSSSRPWFHPFLSFKKGTGVREGVLAWASCGHSCPVKIINTVLNDTLRLISGTNTSTHSAHNR